MLLGVDMGSSSCKAAVFTREGTLMKTASARYGDAGLKDGAVEIPAESFWTAFREVICNVAMQYGNEIHAISISSHGETVIPVDKNGRAVHSALMNADNRGETFSQSLEQRLGRKTVYQITGLPAHPMYSLPKICFFENKYPQEAAKVWKYCTIPDYLHLRMGLQPKTDDTLASRFLAFDIRERSWSDNILRATNMEREKLWDTVASATYIGEISSNVAKELNLHHGIPVFAGGHDQPCGAFGSGLLEHGMALSAGTYECLCTTSSRPLTADEGLDGNFNSYCHVLPQQYITLAFFPAAAVVDWYLERLYGNKINRYAVLDEMRADMEPTGILLTPHLVGACNPHWNPAARGAIYGLSLQTQSQDVIRAVYEGIACELRQNKELLGKYFGCPENIRAFGGNVRSDFTAQLRANITGSQILRLGAGETVCRGAAMLAGVGAGIFQNYTQATEQMSGSAEVFMPNKVSFERYAAQYRQYTGVYSAMQNL